MTKDLFDVHCTTYKEAINHILLKTKENHLLIDMDNSFPINVFYLKGYHEIFVVEDTVDKAWLESNNISMCDSIEIATRWWVMHIHESNLEQYKFEHAYLDFIDKCIYVCATKTVDMSSLSEIEQQEFYSWLLNKYKDKCNECGFYGDPIEEDIKKVIAECDSIIDIYGVLIKINISDELVEELND